MHDSDLAALRNEHRANEERRRLIFHSCASSFEFFMALKVLLYVIL